MRYVVVLIALILFTGCPTSNISNAPVSPNANKPSAGVNSASPVQTANSNSTPVGGVRDGLKIEGPIDFDFKNGIPQGWKKLDPDTNALSGWDTSEGFLKLRIPTGKDLFGENRTAPRLVRDVAGDFEIETTVRFAPTSDYQGAGLLIFRNDSNFLRLERAFGGLGGGEDGIRFDRAEDENYDPIATPLQIAATAGIVELKFRREGKNVFAYWREPGKPGWTEVGRVANTYPETVTVGLIGVNTGEEITAVFERIRLAPLSK